MREISGLLQAPSSNKGEVLETEDPTEDFQSPLLASGPDSSFRPPEKHDPPSLSAVDYSKIQCGPIIKVKSKSGRVQRAPNSEKHDRRPAIKVLY